MCKNYFCDDPIPHYAAHTCNFEPFLHRILLSNPIFIKNSSKADIFYIPIYFCLFNMNRKLADLDQIILPKIQNDFPFFNKFYSLDHLFVQLLFSHEEIPITQYHQKFLPSQITLGDINWTRSLNFPRELVRTTIMPYSSNFNNIYLNNSRDISVFFIGQLKLDHFEKRK